MPEPQQLSSFVEMPVETTGPTYAERQTALVNEFVVSDLADDLADVVHDQTALSHAESLEAVQIMLRYLAEQGSVSEQIGQPIDVGDGRTLCGQVYAHMYAMAGQPVPEVKRRLTLSTFAGWTDLDD